MKSETFSELLRQLMRSMYRHPVLSLAFAVLGIVAFYGIAIMIGGSAFYREEWPVLVFAGFTSSPVLYLLALDGTRFCQPETR